MAKPSTLCLSIALAIITIFIFSVHLNNAQSVKYHPEANFSTTWINNPPSIYINSTDVFSGFKMILVLSLSNTSQFVSGFYCFYNETSCFFGIVVFAKGNDSENYTIVNAPQLWSVNWDRPEETNATLKFTGNGDLILEDADGYMVWSTNTGGKSVTGLRFTETGKLVLFDRNNVPVWQSFDHPTDSLLIGQKLVSSQKLIARRSAYYSSQGLFSLSVWYGYFEANQQLVYYETISEGISNFTESEEEYVSFENGSFNGQSIPLGSTAQFTRLEPDGHLRVYEGGGAEWITMADLLTSGIGETCVWACVCS